MALVFKLSTMHRRCLPVHRVSNNFNFATTHCSIFPFLSPSSYFKYIRKKIIISNHLSLPRPPATCTAPNAGIPGGGGCSSNCYCDSTTDPNFPAICDILVHSCADSCSSTDDCAVGAMCINNPTVVSICGGMVCGFYTSCTSTA